jgi:hypothetical protein
VNPRQEYSQGTSDSEGHLGGWGSSLMQERLFNERDTGAKEAHGASPVLEKVIYNCKCSGCAGFTQYALCVYRPHSIRARAVVASWRADPQLPRQIYTKDFLNFALQHQRRATSYERQVVGNIWDSYLRWRRSQKVSGVGSWGIKPYGGSHEHDVNTQECEHQQRRAR